MGFFRRDSEIKKLVKGRVFELVQRHLQGEVVVPEIISLLEGKVVGGVIPRLTSLLEDKNLLRANAALALGQIATKDPKAVRGAIPGLIGLLQDKEGYNRGNAAWTLGSIGVEEALEKLRGLLSDSAKASIGSEETTVGELAREAIERIEKK